MGAILPLDLLDGDQPEIGLIDQRGSLERVAGTLVGPGTENLWRHAVSSRRLPVPGFWAPALETTRQAVNHWIRTSNAYDAVIDFDMVLRDPSQLSRLRPAYDSGDHAHPNDAGYKAMADAIDLSLFRDENED